MEAVSRRQGRGSRGGGERGDGKEIMPKKKRKDVTIYTLTRPRLALTSLAACWRTRVNVPLLSFRQSIAMSDLLIEIYLYRRKSSVIKYQDTCYPLIPADFRVETRKGRSTQEALRRKGEIM